MIIKGSTVGTTVPRANWDQEDPAKADYIRGKAAVNQAISAARAAAEEAKTAAEEAKTAAGNHESDKENPHGITPGGIGAQVQHWNKVITLSAANWSGGSQSVVVAEMGSDDTVISTPSAESRELYAQHSVKLSAQSAGMLTYTCEDAPAADISVDITCFGAAGSAGTGGSSGGGSGKDGISPVAKVTQTAYGAEISITDANGTTTATVNHGKSVKGDKGNGIAGVEYNLAEDGTIIGFVFYMDNGQEFTYDIPHGEDGYTPQKYVDYWTDADREAIMNEVANQLSLKILNQMTLGYHTDGLLYLFVNGAPVGTGVEFIGGATGDVTGDVTGVIDSVNNIILTGVDGDLPDGTYTIKYEKENGTLVNGGNLVISSGPTYTNLLPTSIDNTGAVYNGNEKGYKNGYRLTGGAYPCESPDDAYFCTGYIPYTKAQANARVPMYVKGITIDLSNVPKYLRVLMVDAYNTTDSYIDTLSITGSSGATNQITIQQLGDKYYKLTPNSGFMTGNFEDWKNKDLQFIRWSFPGTGNGVIFTVDEPID